ncbi:hypothetical protein IVB30_19875 [Bradyrhizobium sp. 200]|uniref:hypothetical protein n=1 Tax=Bradyrhizobium sp. 200 TaxID=2782665 RepID=UPI0020004CD8|nr:hypothetical protein [Bradyrhizobium sp. 200]UPJ53371.1 hypothetical protein IVB30_19875 [Bradyrhizobium sp. 200]
MTAARTDGRPCVDVSPLGLRSNSALTARCFRVDLGLKDAAAGAASNPLLTDARIGPQLELWMSVKAVAAVSAGDRLNPERMQQNFVLAALVLGAIERSESSADV